MEEANFPQPTMNYVVVENPLHNKVETLATDLAKLPENEKANYLRQQVANAFDELEVLAVGPGVTDERLILGAKVATTMSLADQAVTLSTKQYLYLRESAFFAVW